MYIDSHAHLFKEDFGRDLGEVISRARDAGVERIVVPGTNEKTSREGLELAERYEFIYACVGIHPHEALRVTDKLLAEIESMANHQKVVAIGEIGLDYHYDFSPREQQIAAFNELMALAIRKDLPIVVHTRESLKDTVEIVDQLVLDHPRWKNANSEAKREGAPLRGVFHCFTGSASDALGLFGKGFFVSYPGIVTFKNSPVLAPLTQIGYQHILLETDSPYMAPVPLRGKRNEPANIVHIGKKISEIFNVSESEVANVTTVNARKLFGL